MVDLLNEKNHQKSYIHANESIHVQMINNYTIYYILTGIIIAAIVEHGYERRRNGDMLFQFKGPELNWTSRIMTLALWPIITMLAVILIVKEHMNKNNKDTNGN